MIPAADLAALDQLRARVDQELNAHIETFRRAAAETSADEAMVQAAVEMAKWSPKALAGALAAAIARLAR